MQPVLTTYRAKGVIPESWPNAAGLFTGAALEAPALEAADLLVAVGLDSIELIPNPWPYTAPVVSLSEWAEDSPYFTPHAELVAPLDALVGMLATLPDTWPADYAAAQKKAGQDRLLAAPRPHAGLAPQDVVTLARAAAPADAVATVDAGAHMLVCMPLWDTDLVDGMLISSGLATMGFSEPAAIAAAFANPGTRIVCFVGDEGLGMALAELETTRFALPVTVVVFNDSKLSLIALKAKPVGHGGDGAIAYRDVDFAAIGEAMGISSWRVEDAAALTAALQDGFATTGPAIVDAVIDPVAYPHVIDVIRGARPTPRRAGARMPPRIRDEGRHRAQRSDPRTSVSCGPQRRGFPSRGSAARGRARSDPGVPTEEPDGHTTRSQLSDGGA